MTHFYRVSKPLTKDEIFNKLKELRNLSVTPYSNYHVAAIVEVKINDNLYFYTSGVNIEMDGHNILSRHSEQTAVANAITLLGGDTKFSRLWIMAAPADAIPDEKQKAGKSCGFCRQILMSLAAPNAEIYVVTLDGRFSKPDSFEMKFLPDGFSERDVAIEIPSLKDDSSSPFFSSPKFKAWEIINEAKNLSNENIEEYLQALSPHIITKKFQTSPITACIVKCNNGCYAAGVLMQDVAFLTTDAIFSAIGNAITQFGRKIRFDEIHLASSSLAPDQMTFTEIEAMSRHYAHKNTRVHIYAPGMLYTSYSILECKAARNENIDKQLEENYTQDSEQEQSIVAIKD